LARDFWAREDLWSPTAPVKRRWLKLVFVYAVSVLAQVSLLGLIVIGSIDVFVKDVPLRWWIISIGVGSLIALAFAILSASVEYTSVVKQVRRSQ
jgi:hypothetical protein